jgi:hypothetical protein
MTLQTFSQRNLKVKAPIVRNAIKVRTKENRASHYQFTTHG